MKNIVKIIKGSVLASILLSLFCACTNEIAYTPEKPQRSIFAMLNDNPDFTLLIEAFQRGNMATLLNTYGSYTLFAPTNDAINKYLKNHSKTSVNDISSEEWNLILRNQMYANVYLSSDFIPGSLPSATAGGAYMAMDISRGRGPGQVYMNDSIQVTQIDLTATNGVIHVIDGVLEPPVKTTWQIIKDNPAFSIITKALYETEVYTMIDEPFSETGKKLTLFAEPDSIYKKFGIASYEDLKTRYCNLADPTDAEDSLNIFMKYHILPKNQFIVDFNNEYLESGHKDDYIVFTITPDISLNPHTTEDGQSVKTKLLDNFCNRIAENGVIHGIDRPFDVYAPEPTHLTISAVKDVALWPQTGNLGFTTVEEQDPYDWIKWLPANAGISLVASTTLIYGGYAFRIAFVDQTYSIEITTPPVFKGTYKLGLSWIRTTGDAQLCQVYFDGKKMEDGLVNYQTSTQVDVFGKNITASDRQRKNLGSVTLKSIEPHVIRFECVSIGVGRTSSNFTLDCVEFFTQKELGL